MLAIALTLFALTPAAAPQEPPAGAAAGARATLESCLFEDGRWVCRYRMPDIAVVPASGAAAPPDAPAPASPATEEAPVLTTAEADLVLRCAEATWLSLCTPTQRRTARALRDRAEADAALRREVGAWLATGDCAAAERLALQAGRLGLASRVRALCPAPATP